MSTDFDLKMAYHMGYEDALAKRMPEPSKASVLGRGTCKWEPADFITEGEWWNTSCGESFTWEPDGTPRFCPGCGREVEA